MKREDSDGTPDPVEDHATGRRDGTHGIDVEAMDHWDQVIGDMEATAAEYEDQGWATLQLHPGDVTPLSGEHSDRVGMDVLVPDPEYEALESMLGSGIEFGDYRVYKNQQGSVVFALLAMEDASTEQAVLVPLFYSVSNPDTMDVLDRAREEGVLRSYVRRLQGDFVELAHDDPELFGPVDDEE
ncbi:hypothetical protein BRD00_06855 [Halobacteriales archaeon QS_8_69_26]|nr:MAG: hypothetical protein BRD00_06855 [Halobacteriales archaeon QS_8_69_26]